MKNDFAVFILSHGRPNNVITYDMLRNQGYTGRIYIIIDDEDSTGDEYRVKYEKQVITFSKALVEPFDVGDNLNPVSKSVVWARNACFEIAKALGIKYFLQLDDDYKHFEYRVNSRLEAGYFGKVRNLDQLFNAVLEFYKSIPALTIAFSQGGDLIGGKASTSLKKLWLKRKAMNSFFCCVDRPFKFVGRVNEDTTTYVHLGHRGALIFTIFNANIVQTRTQSQIGGMTDIYLEQGTFVKSFYTLMFNPSCVSIYEMGDTHKRLHHKINWNAAVPVIMSEKYRKV